MVRVYYVRAALLAIALLSGCQEHEVVQQSHPATLEQTDQKGIMRVILTERAVERVGIQTASVLEEASGAAMRKVVPYGAILYDKKGHTWTFTNPQPRVFVRQQVSVERIDGDRVYLTEGPPAGTAVVTVGAAELMGAEDKYGH